MARILDRVVGHKEQIERLLQSKEAGHLPSTLLFTGSEGIGKALVAKGLAQALVCESSTRACGDCGPCKRVERDHSEAVRWIAPEKNQIKIEQAREIIGFLSLRAVTPHRIVIFESAQALNVQAANTLLKVLEEPPEQTIFILIAPTPRHVLPTMRSRAVRVEFHPLSIAELASQMKAPQWAYEAAQGSLQRLAEVMNSGDVRGAALELLQWWLDDTEAYLRPAFRERIKDKVLAAQLIRYFQGFFRDVEVYRTGERRGLQYIDQINLLAKYAEKTLSVDRLFQMSLGLERELVAHRDLQLIFEEFWIRSHSPDIMAT